MNKKEIPQKGRGQAAGMESEADKIQREGAGQGWRLRSLEAREAWGSRKSGV